MARGLPVNPYSGSLNPIDAASRVANIPQNHSLASWDKQKSAEMIHNFTAAEGKPVDAYIAPEASPVPAPPALSPATTGPAPTVSVTEDH